jgi:hypothetical protein
MNKHTPGPWVVSDDGDVTLIIHAPKDEVDIARMSNDCEMFSEIRANAHLIAAAPAMYEALKGMVSMYDSLNKSNKHDGACPCYHCQARAALAQAEGKP